MKISVVIPALREAEIINGTIRHVFGLPFDTEPEVIVADGCPRASSIRAIEDARVTRVTAGMGRARQMNAGAARATGAALLFLHADSRLPQDAPALIGAALEDTGTAGGAFDLGIDSHRAVFRLIEMFASLRSRLTRIPYGDQAIFIRRDVFCSLGGYADLPIMEDVELMRRMKRRGMKIKLIRSRVKTSPRRWQKEGVLRCTLRNWTLACLFAVGVPPGKLVRFYQPDH